jgi:hypothetical protein
VQLEVPLLPVGVLKTRMDGGQQVQGHVVKWKLGSGAAKETTCRLPALYKAATVLLADASKPELAVTVLFVLPENTASSVGRCIRIKASSARVSAKTSTQA